MTTQPISDDSPGTDLFPEYASLYELIASEVRGLSDEQVLSVVLITCTFNFMTRLADGLGVVFPDNAQNSVERWLTGPAREQEWLIR